MTLVPFWDVCRFKEGMALSEEEVAAFEDYFYHITAARGSGEHALRHILKPFAWAHNPLEPQLQHLKVCLFCQLDHNSLYIRSYSRVSH